MALKIEPLAEWHFPGLRDAFDPVAQEKRFLAFTEAPPPAEARAFYLAMLASKTCFQVATSDRVILGWCDIQTTPGQARAHVGSLGMGVVPTARRLGVGSTLMKATIQAAWETALSRVELTVRSDNSAAIALYEKHGFIVEGCLRNAFKVDGEYFDAYGMAILKQH